MPRAYPKRELITDYDSFKTQLADEDSRYYFYQMVMLAEKERKRLAEKQKRKRAKERLTSQNNPTTPT